jgi:hypothetical protein
VIGNNREGWFLIVLSTLILKCGTACMYVQGNGEGFSYYWNYSTPGVTEWRVADNIAFVLNGSTGVDGLFTDEMEMFPGDAGDVMLELLGKLRLRPVLLVKPYQVVVDSLLCSSVQGLRPCLPQASTQLGIAVDTREGTGFR